MHRTTKFLTFAACAVISASAFAAPAIYTGGHADIRTYYEDGQLELYFQLSGGAIVNGQVANPGGSEEVNFSLSDLIVTIADVPFQSPDNRFDFTGATVGENLWFIPEGAIEAENFGLPWLGFSTEEFNYDDSWVGNQLFVDLITATGPGDVSMFFSPEDELTPPQVHFATLDGIDASDSYRQYGSADLGLSTGAHSHVNWAFTQPGFYDLTLRFSGEHSIDGYKEAFGTIKFAVAVPEPSTLGILGLGATCLVSSRSRRVIAAS